MLPSGDPVRGEGWCKGPMPPDTWLWGAVCLVGEGAGFRFADFRGDHVLVMDPETPSWRRVEAAEVAWYNNGIGEPPGGPE